MEESLVNSNEMDSIQILTEIRAIFAMWVLRALSKDLESAFITETSIQLGRCPDTGQIQCLLCDSPESLTYAFTKIQKLLIEKSVQHASSKMDNTNCQCIEDDACTNLETNSNDPISQGVESQVENIPSIVVSTGHNSISVDESENNNWCCESQGVPVVDGNHDNVVFDLADENFSNKAINKVNSVSFDKCTSEIVKENQTLTESVSEITNDCVSLGCATSLDLLNPTEGSESPLHTDCEANSITLNQTEPLREEPMANKINVKDNNVTPVLCEISQCFDSNDGSGWLDQNLGLRRSSRRRLVNKRYKLWMSNTLPMEEVDGGASTDDGKSRKNYEETMPFKHFCEQCSFKTKRISHLKKHKAIHKKVKTMYSCGQCPFTSMRLGHLRRHEASHSSVLHKCDKCTYSTDDAKLLTRHCKQKHHSYKVSKDSRLLKCKECTYKTQRQHLFDRHKRIHCVHTHQCDQCPYRTWRKEHYNRHVNNVHKNKRPYLCHLCGKAFKRGDSLRHHQTIFHSSDPGSTCLFPCDMCGKTFRTQSHLDEHSAVHSNIRSFLCEICGASFKTRSVQRKHVQTIHQNPRSKSCIYCDKKFNTVFALRRHLKVHNCKEETDEPQPKKNEIFSEENGEPSTSTALVPLGDKNNVSILSENKISFLTLVPPVEGEVLHETVLTADMISTLHPSTVLQSTEVTSAVLFLTSTSIL